MMARIEKRLGNLILFFSLALVFVMSGCPVDNPIADADVTTPEVPTGLVVTAVSSNQINLVWNASTDDVGVAGYKIFRGGEYLESVVSGTSTCDTGLSASTQYCYCVSAYDAADNESAQSAQECATTGTDITWNNEYIGKYTITEAGTYTILGTCQGLIRVNTGISGTVYINGPGTLEDIDDDIDDRPHVVRCGTGSVTIVDGLTIRYQYRQHKAIDLLGEGSIIRNCSFYSLPDRDLAAGHIQVGKNGLIENCYANIIDDTYKVKYNGARVQNSTAEMMGNGSAITLDWGGASGPGHYADSITVRGYTFMNPVRGDAYIPAAGDPIYANHSALCAVVADDVSDVNYTNITVEDGPDFAHIIKLYQHAAGKTLSDVYLAGTLPDGASQKVSSGVMFSPVTINAAGGTIRDVTIDFGGALSNSAWHYLNGDLRNVNIDGVIYNGVYNDTYGDQVVDLTVKP